MTGESDRLARAGDYVFGLMSEAQRGRAERDLERDPAFRDAVLIVAARMRAFDHLGLMEEDDGERWKTVSQRLGTLPQMPAATGTGIISATPGKRDPWLSWSKNAVRAFALLAAFALGYLAGKL